MDDLGRTISKYNKENYSDQKLENKLENEIIANLGQWLRVQRYHWLPGEMFASLYTIRKSLNHHSIFHEVEEVCKIIDSVISDLQNLFDNYICFEGKDDKDLFEKRCENACIRAVNALRSRKFTNNELIKNIFNMAYKTVLTIVQNHNQIICANESALAADITFKALTEFEKIISNILMKSTSVKDYETYTNRVKQTLINIIVKCMDHDGRLSHIQTETVQKLFQDASEIINTNKVKLLENILKLESPARYAVYMYQKRMKQIFENLAGHDETTIEKFHKEAFKLAVEGLKEFDTNNVRNIIRGQYINNLQTRSEQIQLTKLPLMQKENPTKTLCIYLTSQWIQVFTMQNEVLTPLVYNNENTIPPLVALQNNKVIVGSKVLRYIFENKKLDNILNIERCLKNASTNDKTCELMVIGLFRNLKIDAEKAFKNYFARILVLVPGWYGPQHFQVVRNCTEQVGFLEIFIVRESTVASLMILQEENHLGRQRIKNIAASFTILESGIFVELFVNKFENDVLLEMLAVSFAAFPKSKTQGFLKTFNRNDILNLAFNKAIDQVSVIQKGSNILCFMFDESDDWQSDFKCFCKGHQNIVFRNLARDKYAIHGAGKLLIDSRGIRSKIQDCVTVEMKKSNSSYDKCEADDNVNDEIANEVPKQVENSEELRRRKENLLRLCTHMRQQIDRGEVKVSRLLMNDVIEILEIAEGVALEENMIFAEVEQQENEVNEVFNEYNFFKVS